MPKCQFCGNIKSFGASKIPPSATCANGPISGIIGEFNQEKELIFMHSSGATKAIINAVSQNPKEFFDVCVRCGETSIAWDDYV